jgi:DNA-binding response OmpR family regulator
MAGNAHHVLVIEDDAESTEQLVDCVRTNGYAVDLSMDGEGAAKRSRSASLGLLAYSLFSRRLRVFPPRGARSRG